MISVKVFGAKEAKDKLRGYGVVIKGASAKTIRNVGLRVMNQAKINAPVDMGELKSSIGIDFSPEIPQAIVGTNLSYAPAIEYGSRPHFPPVEPLEEWAKRHGMEGAGYAIARKIAERGTSPKPFMRPAAMEAQGYLKAEMSREIKNAIK